MSILDAIQVAAGQQGSAPEGGGTKQPETQPTPEELAAAQAEKDAADAKAQQEQEERERLQAEELAKKQTEETATDLVKTKHKVDYLEFIEKHSDAISAYRSEKSTDYSQLPSEKILEKSLKLEYPTLSDEDIKDELKIRYGIGEDTEDYEGEELIAYRAKQRKMKIDAADGVKKLEAYREALTLPDFELELEEKTPEQVDLEEAYKERSQKVADDAASFRKDVWTPKVSEALSGITEITREIDLGGDIGKVTVTVPLDDSDRKNITEYLGEWVYHPTDAAYLKEGEDPDLKAFAQDRGAVVISEKLLAAAGLAAVEKYKETHIKKNVINFSDEPRTTSVKEDTVSGAVGVASLLRKK